jgi:hypothetical protein
MDVVSVHQELMDKAYELYDDSLSYENFLYEITKKLGQLYVDAVITGNLNYQVENGGFTQWYENGYSNTIDQLNYFFSNNFLQNNEIIKKILQILENVKKIIDWQEHGEKEINKINYDYREFFSGFLQDYTEKELSRIDFEYDKIAEELDKLLEEYFEKESIKE